MLINFIQVQSYLYLCRGGRGSRGYQVPPRHQEDNRPNRFTNNTAGSQQYGQYATTGPQKTKPPRFQRNQEAQNSNQNYSNFHQEPIGSFSKFPQINEFRCTMPSVAPFSQPRQDAATPRDYSNNSKQNQQDYQAKVKYLM